MEPTTLVLLVVAALFAGFVDAVVGGGGVITLPALLAAGLPPHLAVGTNKVVGTGASSVATWQYGRAGLVSGLAWKAFPVAVAASVAGAVTVLHLPEDVILNLVAVVIGAIVMYVLLRPQFGQEDRRDAVTRPLATVLALTAVFAFYDGLLGPGTGTFLLFGLVTLAGMPVVRAAAHGRVLNFGSNIGALAYFAVVGNVDWLVGLVMATGTLTGGFLGARFGIRHGQRWVRPLFVAVALALLVRLLWPTG